MKYNDTIDFVIHFIVFWIFMLGVFCEWAFGWPTNEQLSYIALGWTLAMCCSALYVWYLELKQ